MFPMSSFVRSVCGKLTSIQRAGWRRMAKLICSPEEACACADLCCLPCESRQCKILCHVYTSYKTMTGDITVAVTIFPHRHDHSHAHTSHG